jgi:uncharacterized membrane protein
MTAQPPAVQPQPAPSAGQMTLGPFVSKAWAMVMANLALFIVSYLIVGVLASIPLVNLIIGGPLFFGLLRIIQKRYKGEPAEIGQVFDGFKDFSKGLVTMLLMIAVYLVLFIALGIVGFILGLIPCIGVVLAGLVGFAAGVAVQAAMFFFLMIAALSDASPTDALSRSVKFCLANLWPMVLLSLVTGLIGMAGIIACGIGMFFTIPLALCIAVIAYNEYYLPNAPAA